MGGRRNASLPNESVARPNKRTGRLDKDLGFCALVTYRR
jgi:hypothetical protein